MFFRKLMTLLIASLVFISLFAVREGGAQNSSNRNQFGDRERLIMKKAEQRPPVLIKAAKAKGRLIPLSKKFLDDDDWLKGFTVSVRNLSGKPITHIGLEMLFRRDDEKQLPAGWFLNYGPNPFHYRSNELIPTSGAPVVLPRDEIELNLPDVEFDDLMAFLHKAGFPEKIHVVEIRIKTIGFADGTAWYGKMLKRDKDAKAGWTILPGFIIATLARYKPQRRLRAI